MKRYRSAAVACLGNRRLCNGERGAIGAMKSGVNQRFGDEDRGLFVTVGSV
ncbi:hypothetical protein TIFTF001_014354 [Ficus carica]|uniref:Uncharacterized protein n=1 Tax=Ficus carica TaxID=3494 RepID=A0AA88D835_FICCA|nr:hypothetical protein TIFTF001_014354 [Ficus carica]